MKKQTDINFSKIRKEQINDLTKVVNETIGIDFVQVTNSTMVDLWNIQRRSKTKTNRKHLV
jgi:hypothetical protein